MITPCQLKNVTLYVHDVGGPFVLLVSFTTYLCET